MVKELIGDKSTEEAAKEMIAKSNFTSKEKLLEFSDEGYEAVLNSNDPFIYYVLKYSR